MAVGQPALGRSEAVSSYVWILAAVGLVGFGAASGVAIAFGEANAFYITLSIILGAAVMADYRVGAVALILLLPMVATYFLPHSMFGIPALNPFNVVVAATLGSCLIRGHVRNFAPPVLVWCYVVPILVAGEASIGTSDPGKGSVLTPPGFPPFDPREQRRTC